jgi:hypothetical protein
MGLVSLIKPPEAPNGSRRAGTEARESFLSERPVTIHCQFGLKTLYPSDSVAARPAGVQIVAMPDTLNPMDPRQRSG